MCLSHLPRYAVNDASAAAWGLPSHDPASSPAFGPALLLPPGACLPHLRYTFALRAPHGTAADGAPVVDADASTNVEVRPGAVLLAPTLSPVIHPRGLPLQLRASVVQPFGTIPGTGGVVDITWQCWYRPHGVGGDDGAAALVQFVRQLALGVNDAAAAATGVTLLYTGEGDDEGGGAAFSPCSGVDVTGGGVGHAAVSLPTGDWAPGE